MKETEHLITHCDCEDSDHLMSFHLFAYENEPPDLYLSVQLNPWGLWKRLWLALWYVLGRRSKFGWGHWDSGSISENSARELRALLRKYLIAMRKWQEGKEVRK